MRLTSPRMPGPSSLTVTAIVSSVVDTATSTINGRTGKTIYGKAGNGYVVIASKGGAPNHPDWYLNLEANPTCHVQVARDHHDCRARVATGAEREALWAQLAKIYPPYDQYQVTAGPRQIPVVVLDPIS